MINVDAITELIKNLINKEIHKSTLISSVPCRVIESLENEMYTVQLVTDNSQYTLPNMSGSSLSVGENVQLFYYGEYISSKSSYIGASLNKDSGGSLIYIYGINSNGEIGGEKVLSIFRVKALDETTISLSFNTSILGTSDDNFSVLIFIDETAYDYEIKGSTTLNKYTICNFNLPIELSKGEHIITVRVSGMGNVSGIKSFLCGYNIEEINAPNLRFLYRFTANNAHPYLYIDTPTIVDVPMIAEGALVDVIEGTTFMNNKDIVSLNIPDGVTTIE